MRIKELIEELKKYPEEMEVQIQIFESYDNSAWWEDKYYTPDLKVMYQENEDDTLLTMDKVLVIY